MALITYSHDPNSTYRKVLHDAGKGNTIYVFERNYHNGEDLWYEAHDDRVDELWKETGEFTLEMKVPAFDECGPASLRSRTIINKVMRRIDESNLWPICGAYNATNRAIRRLRKWERDGREFDSAMSYWLALDNEISNIVNKEA